jgi:hypothetical protein
MTWLENRLVISTSSLFVNRPRSILFAFIIFVALVVVIVVNHCFNHSLVVFVQFYVTRGLGANRQARKARDVAQEDQSLRSLSHESHGSGGSGGSGL